MNVSPKGCQREFVDMGLATLEIIGLEKISMRKDLCLQRHTCEVGTGVFQRELDCS